MINSFKGEYSFLSNFFEIPVRYDGLLYRNSEAAFQAQKTNTKEERQKFTTMDASSSKRLGKSVTLRSDWEDIKDRIMYEICLAKFAQNPDLAQKLIDTKDEYLIEGNTWHDYYWGKCNGKGLNKLGEILMTIRDKVFIGL